MIGRWRSDAGGSDTYAGCASVLPARWPAPGFRDTNAVTSIGNVATLTPGVAYDVSVTCTVGASTNDSQVTAKVYLLNSDTQVGSTVSSSTANLTYSSASAVLPWR